MRSDVSRAASVPPLWLARGAATTTDQEQAHRANRAPSNEGRRPSWLNPLWHLIARCASIYGSRRGRCAICSRREGVRESKRRTLEAEAFGAGLAAVRRGPDGWGGSWNVGTYREARGGLDGPLEVSRPLRTSEMSRPEHGAQTRPRNRSVSRGRSPLGPIRQIPSGRSLSDRSHPRPHRRRTKDPKTEHVGKLEGRVRLIRRLPAHNEAAREARLRPAI